MSRVEVSLVTALTNFRNQAHSSLERKPPGSVGFPIGPLRSGRFAVGRSTPSQVTVELFSVVHQVVQIHVAILVITWLFSVKLSIIWIFFFGLALIMLFVA